MRPLAAFLLVVLLARVAGAQTAPDAPGSPPAAQEAAPDAVVAVEVGDPAPFAGILFSEARFMVVAGMKLRIDELEGFVGNRDREIVSLSEALAEERAQRGVVNDPGWFARNGIWIGVALGTVLTIAALYGANEFIKGTEP